MAGPRPSSSLLALLLCTSCTTILGVDDGVLDESGGTTATTTSASSAGNGTPTTTGGDGGAATSSTASGGGGSGGEGGGCPLDALPACPGVQPNSFVVPSDLSTHWDVITPQAEVNASDQLLLRVLNGSTEARIQAKVALQQPASCAVWVRLQLPNGGGGVESGLAITGATGTHAIFRLEDELRARDPAGGTTAVAWDAVDTARVRARFDAAGDLWLDTSADGTCWTTVDGPFVVGGDPLDVQIFVERPGSAGNASSTFDDYAN